MLIFILVYILGKMFGLLKVFGFLFSLKVVLGMSPCSFDKITYFCRVHVSLYNGN